MQGLPQVVAGRRQEAALGGVGAFRLILLAGKFECRFLYPFLEMVVAGRQLSVMLAISRTCRRISSALTSSTMVTSAASVPSSNRRLFQLASRVLSG
jgi:hypothetical protein